MARRFETALMIRIHNLVAPLLAWLAEAWGPLAPAHYVAFTCVIGAGVAAWIIAKRPLRY